MSHPRVEEVSDSEPEEMDIDDLPAGSIMAPAHIPQPGTRAAPPPPTTTTMTSNLPVREMLQPQMQKTGGEADKERSKNWICLYPVYFDRSRTRNEGRRVGVEDAVENPLAREIVDAVQSIGVGLNIVFEPGKMHPKDWANPGRVRVNLKERGSPKVKNKHQLYRLVSEYLRANPANEETPSRLPIQGMPTPKEYIPPAIPKGWKMSTILPLHSPALSGGGVSENFFKEMMAEMQGGQPESSGEGKKKKDKKKVKA